jgi:DNA replication initiation complex subunit (GINS family)
VAIALVNTSMGTSATDPATLSFTCNSGANLLVVLYLFRDTSAGGEVAGMTYDGTAMTVPTNANIFNTSVGAALGYLYDPPTGSALTISVDLASAATAGRIVAAAFSGADTTFAPSGATDGEQGVATPNPTVSITPEAVDGVIVAGCAHEGAAIMTSKGTGQTALGGDADGFVDEGVWNTAFTYELNTTTDANAQTFINATDTDAALVAAWFKPSAGTTPVSTTRAIKYDIVAFVNATRALRYDIRNLVDATRALRYDIRNLIAAERRVVYDLTQYVAAERRVVYDMSGMVAATRAVLYDIRGLVAAERQLRYEIRNLVGAERRIVYEVLNSVVATRAVLYDILGATLVAAERRVIYDMRNAVAADRRVRYDLIAYVNATRALLYDIGDPLVPARRRTDLHHAGVGSYRSGDHSQLR